MGETPSRRDHLVDIALGLFLQHGFHATGVDTIIKEAGVSKKTLYHHFRTKEALIVACLDRYNGTFLADFTRMIETRADSPRAKLLAIFDVAHDWFRDSAFYGCLFIKAIGEYPDDEPAIRAACIAFKGLIRTYIADLCRQLPPPTDGAAQPVLAHQIALLLEGAIVTAQVSQDPGAALTARSIAATLIPADRA